MIAHKFLRAGRVGPFSGVVWDDGPVHAGRGPGVSACRPRDLPYWLGDERRGRATRIGSACAGEAQPHG